MMFLFKKKEIHLDVFTNRPEVMEYYPVDYATKFYPDWWKALPKEYEPSGMFFPASTMKRCVGFTDYHKYGIIIPLWSDLAFVTHPGIIAGSSWKFSDEISSAVSHDTQQFAGFDPDNKYAHIKINSPWIFNCGEEINFTWSQPSWNFNNHSDYFIPPGVLNYKYQCATNINMFINVNNSQNSRKFMIEAGQPMINILPMSERQIKIHRHVLNEQEYKTRVSLGYNLKFTNKYTSQKIIRQSNEKRCPFGFGGK